MSARLQLILKNAFGVKTLGALTQLSERELRDCLQMGETYMNELKQVLTDHHLTLRLEVDPMRGSPSRN